MCCPGLQRFWLTFPGFLNITSSPSPSWCGVCLSLKLRLLLIIILQMQTDIQQLTSCLVGSHVDTGCEAQQQHLLILQPVQFPLKTFKLILLVPQIMVLRLGLWKSCISFFTLFPVHPSLVFVSCCYLFLFFFLL